MIDGVETVVSGGRYETRHFIDDAYASSKRMDVMNELSKWIEARMSLSKA